MNFITNFWWEGKKLTKFFFQLLQFKNKIQFNFNEDDKFEKNQSISQNNLLLKKITLPFDYFIIPIHHNK